MLKSPIPGTAGASTLTPQPGTAPETAAPPPPALVLESGRERRVGRASCTRLSAQEQSLPRESVAWECPPQTRHRCLPPGCGCRRPTCQRGDTGIVSPRLSPACTESPARSPPSLRSAGRSGTRWRAAPGRDPAGPRPPVHGRAAGSGPQSSPRPPLGARLGLESVVGSSAGT